MRKKIICKRWPSFFLVMTLLVTMAFSHSMTAAGYDAAMSEASVSQNSFAEENSQHEAGETEDFSGIQDSEEFNNVMQDESYNKEDNAEESRHTAESVSANGLDQESGMLYVITEWEWVDEEDILVETEEGWELNLSGVDDENPVKAADLIPMLPEQLMAVIQGDEEPADIEISWDLTGFPEEGITTGEYLAKANLPEEYVLDEETEVPEVIVKISGIQLLNASEDNLNASTVTGISPPGTVINLFDYWLESQEAPDNGLNGSRDIGINEGHKLYFGKGMGQNADVSYENLKNYVNYWTQSEAVRQGIVQNRLVSGYPVLSQDQLGGESLRYLFDPAMAVEGKASYPGAEGLLQVDEDGYYYYNSQKNFAEYQKDSGNFVLYNTWGVEAGGTSPDGQFFPFNTGSQVFQDQGEGIVQNDIDSVNALMNHYFGMTMSTRFIQVNEGHVTEGGNPITYEFSGDDDVWVFIDGVLVADLGGIHDMASLKIDFSTGNIIINENTGHEIQTNLRAKFEAAGAETGSFAENRNTFADNTYHTLNFYYLERGNTDSNMSLKFNLVTIPESSVIKVDQTGTPLSDITFELYAADADYHYDKENRIASGVTDATGSFVFKGDKDDVLNLNELYQSSKEDNTAYFVLKETGLPAGYRSSGDVKFRLIMHKGEVIPLSSNQWETGAYAAANANVSTGAVLELDDGKTINLDGGSGTAFAVIMKLEKGQRQGVITGTVERGFTVHEGVTEIQGILDTLRSNPQNYYTFAVDSSGNYKTVISDLPGDVTKYKYMLTNNQSPDEAEYEVIYYYTSAAGIDGAAADNTWQVQSDDFDRQFSTNIYVPNIKNHLLVQKVDENGKPLNGAVLELYKSGDVTVNADGSYTVAEGAQPYDSLTTYTGDYAEGYTVIPLSGGGVFPSSSTGILPEGTYYLIEKSAPAGYIASSAAVKVIVAADGVFADAGEVNDSVRVRLGVGSLVRSMIQFANSSLDAPVLELIEAAERKGVMNKDVLDWTAADWNAENRLALDYSAEDKILAYGPAEEGGSVLITVESGWSRLQIRSETDKGLGGGDLTGLFSGTTTVQVTNQTEQIDITARKIWEDDENKDGTRPGSAELQLYQDGKPLGQGQKADASNSWTVKWTGLPKYNTDNPKLYTYTVKETSVPEGYQSVAGGDPEQGFTVTNSRRPSLSIEKEVTGDYGDRTKLFVFQITLENQAGGPVSGSYPVSIAGSDRQVPPEIKFEDGKAELQLKHGETAVISDLPAGSTYCITEESGNEYELTFFLDENEQEGDRVQGTLSHSRITVKAVNEHIDVPDTGVADYGNIGLLLTGSGGTIVLGACGGLWLKLRRRKRQMCGRRYRNISKKRTERQ